MAFNPEHKVTYEQLSKSLQDRLTAATAGVSELQKLIEEAKKSITSLVDSSTSTIGTKIDTLKTKITTESSETSVVIEQKKKEITNNLKSASGQTTAKLMSGESGQFGKVDPSNKTLFGDNGFDVILVYNSISTQEKSQLTVLTPKKIAENYGVNAKRVQAAFDLDKRKLLIYNGTTWQDIEDQDKITEYFSKYLTNRSFYVNPLTKNLYFYCFDGKWTLINRLVNTGIEDIGKIIGNIGEIKYDPSLLMPEVTDPIKPPKPPVPPVIPTKDKVRRNEGDFTGIGKLFLYPKMAMRRNSKTDQNRRYSGGPIVGIYKNAVGKIIKTAYGQDAYMTINTKYLNDYSTTYDLYIPKLTLTIYDTNFFIDRYRVASNATPKKVITATYDDLISGMYDAELNDAVSYFIRQNIDLDIEFGSYPENGIAIPPYIYITSAPLLMGSNQITPTDITNLQVPHNDQLLITREGRNIYHLAYLVKYLGTNSFWGEYVELNFTNKDLTKKTYINQLSKNYFNEPTYSEFIPAANVISLKPPSGISSNRVIVNFPGYYIGRLTPTDQYLYFGSSSSSPAYLLPTSVPNTTPIKDEYLLSGELHLLLWTGMETFGK